MSWNRNSNRRINYLNFSSYTYINLLLPITSVHVLAVPVVHVPGCGVLQHVGGGHQVQGLYGDTPLAYTAFTTPSFLLNTYRILRAIKQILWKKLESSHFWLKCSYPLFHSNCDWKALTNYLFTALYLEDWPTSLYLLFVLYDNTNSSYNPNPDSSHNH